MSIPRIAIGRSNGHFTVKKKTQEDVMKRVGLCLQKMLRSEYGDAYDGDLSKKKPQEIMAMRNTRIAHLTPAQALQSLKRALKIYSANEEPFDRPLYPNETV